MISLKFFQNDRIGIKYTLLLSRFNFRKLQYLKIVRSNSYSVSWFFLDWKLKWTFCRSLFSPILPPISKSLLFSTIEVSDHFSKMNLKMFQIFFWNFLFLQFLPRSFSNWFKSSWIEYNLNLAWDGDHGADSVGDSDAWTEKLTFKTYPPGLFFPVLPLPSFP